MNLKEVLPNLIVGTQIAPAENPELCLSVSTSLGGHAFEDLVERLLIEIGFAMDYTLRPENSLLQSIWWALEKRNEFHTG